jgi:predicted phage replisome organizer
MPDIKWIKLDTGIFDDEKIKIILSMPEGKSMLVIWLKLLCLAGRINNSGVLMVNKTIPYTVEMLGAVFGEQEQIMRLAVDTFERLGMVDEYNGALLIPNWEKHQNGYKLELIREQTRARVEQYRERQKLSVTQNSVTSALQVRNVTLQNKNQELRTKNQETKRVRGAAAPARTARGEYGWVKLSDEEYARLQADLGETELDRCIRYVDESAQGTGNKNKWKDWALTIRRCARDKWGVAGAGTSKRRLAFQAYDQGDPAVSNAQELDYIDRQTAALLAEFGELDRTGG